MKGQTRRWLALAAISVSVLVVSLDLTVLSLALPTIAGTMRASTGDLRWVTVCPGAPVRPGGRRGCRAG